MYEADCVVPTMYTTSTHNDECTYIYQWEYSSEELRRKRYLKKLGQIIFNKKCEAGQRKAI